MAILQIAITKGKGSIEVDTDKLPEDVFREMCIQGLKTLANRGMSKITKSELPNADELKSAAMAKAADNLEAIYAGKIKFTGATKKAGISGAVKTEAMRLARNIVKDELKKAGKKISHYEASEITTAAKELLEGTPSLLEMAKANIEERTKVATSTIDVSKIAISAKKVAAAEAKKAKAGTLSKTQAGKVAKRAKGEAHA